MKNVFRHASSFARRLILLTALVSAVKFSAPAAGLFGDGLDARTIAVGGAEAAQSGSAIAAMNSNPAALSSDSLGQFEIAFGGTFVDADFHRDHGATSRMSDLSGYIPAAALTIAAPKNFPLHFGIAVLPDIMAEVDWRYPDAPGGLGGTTSYGEQTNRSRIIALRTNAGLSVAVSRWFSLGASGGAIYSEDRLQAPYIFQSQPVLAGFKTLLDLEADGFGAAFNFGAQFRPAANFTIGLSYRPETVIHSEGHASGNASAQLQALGGGFALVDPAFRYDAEVRTVMPQIASVACEWQALPRLRVIGGFDWINWSDAFDQLVINLRHGSNPAINGVVGADFMTDIAPLRWRDQFVPRAGLEFSATEQIKVRGGYSYARSAVPSETLNPLNAAIFEHKVSLGAGWRSGRYHTDLAWLWALPAKQHVGQSALLDGEYSDTSVCVTQHSLEWSAGIDF